jgi:hypothetical protein
MKIEVEIKTENTLGIEFPLLAKSTFNDDVILFLNESTGMIVSSSREANVGVFYKSLINPLQSENWKVLPRGSSVEFTQGYQP